MDTEATLLRVLNYQRALAGIGGACPDRRFGHQTEYRPSSLLRDHGIVSVLNVPVMLDGENWGVLEVDADEPVRSMIVTSNF